MGLGTNPPASNPAISECEKAFVEHFALDPFCGNVTKPPTATLAISAYANVVEGKSMLDPFRGIGTKPPATVSCIPAISACENLYEGKTTWYRFLV